MDVYQLMEKLGGELVLGRARVRVGSQIVVIGTLNGNDMVFTDDGRRLLAEHETVPDEPKRRGGRPAKAAVVESEPTSTPEADDQLSLFADAGLT